MAVCGSQRSASTDELVVQVDRRLDRRVGLPRTPLLAGQDPGDLECVAVGVSAVDRLRGTVICLALEAAFGVSFSGVLLDGLFGPKLALVQSRPDLRLITLIRDLYGMFAVTIFAMGEHLAALPTPPLGAAAS